MNRRRFLQSAAALAASDLTPPGWDEDDPAPGIYGVGHIEGADFINYLSAGYAKVRVSSRENRGMDSGEIDIHHDTSSVTVDFVSEGEAAEIGFLADLSAEQAEDLACLLALSAKELRKYQASRSERDE